jgi:acetyl esterase/lipase
MEIGVTHKGTRERLITENAVWNHHVADWYSLEKQVTRFTPPTFLALCSDDKVVPAENSLMYYNSLIDHDVPAELHIWPNGGHGWGFASEKYNGKGKDSFSEYRSEFEVSLERWLQKVKK